MAEYKRLDRKNNAHLTGVGKGDDDNRIKDRGKLRDRMDETFGERDILHYQQGRKYRKVYK